MHAVHAGRTAVGPPLGPPLQPSWPARAPQHSDSLLPGTVGHWCCSYWHVLKAKCSSKCSSSFTTTGNWYLHLAAAHPYVSPRLP